MYDAVVIGAGQAGLAIGFYLKQAKQSFLLIDKAKEIGESWINRYDSLTLFTPRANSELPDFKMKGPRQEYPSKDEVADYLAKFASYHSLPTQLNTTVTKVTKVEHGFKIETSKEVILAKNIVIQLARFKNHRSHTLQGTYPIKYFKSIQHNTKIQHNSKTDLYWLWGEQTPVHKLLLS